MKRVSTMDEKELLQAISERSLEELAPAMELIAERVRRDRLAHQGLVPLSIFPFCLAIGGIYPAVEILPCINNAFALRKRDEASGEQGWDGEYHIPGVCGRITDTPETILIRLNKELFGAGREGMSFSDLNFIGISIHNNEAERGCVCWSLLYTLDLQEISELAGDWKLFGCTDDPSIIKHHRDTLKWYLMGSDRDFFAKLD